MTEITKKQRERVMASTGNLQSYMDRHHMTNRMMGDALGVTGSAISKYLRDQKMPHYLQLALECLVRREGGANRVYVVTVPKDKNDAFINVLNAMDVKAVGLPQ